jgi:hypothetical protein
MVSWLCRLWKRGNLEAAGLESAVDASCSPPFAAAAVER